MRVDATPSVDDGSSSAAPNRRAPNARLIACSQGRSLIARWNSTQRDFEIIKVYESGTLEEARAEAAIGERLSNLPGLVTGRGADIDSQRGRPCVVMDYHQGSNLEAWIAEHGAATPRATASVGRQLARSLAAMHAAGFIHRDVKPANVYLADDSDPHPARSRVMLLDFEHTVSDRSGAAAGGSASEPALAEGFTGGTHGFAPPEAYRAATPSVAFDAFGFGATLYTLLTGRRPFRAATAEGSIRAVLELRRPAWPLRGMPAPLVQLIEGCLSAAERPSLAAIESTLTEYLAAEPDPDEAAMDRAVAALHVGECTMALAEWNGTGSTGSPRRAELAERIKHTRRLLDRLPNLPPPSAWVKVDDEAELATVIAREAPRLCAFLERFPAHPEALALRGRLRREHEAMLRRVPRKIPEFKRSARFDAAIDLLQRTLGAVDASQCLPHSAPRTESSGANAVPGALLRDPHRYLRSALETVRADAAVYRELLARLERAEARLDLDETASILDSASDHYSGATEIVAGLKDRLHRLRFYLRRLALPQLALDTLSQQLTVANLAVDLRPLGELQDRCRAVFDGSQRTPASDTKLGLRSLRRLLRDVSDEFPHLADLVAGAAQTLDQAMDALTERAWAMLAEAHARLSAVPVPIRPLQALVNGLDNLRLLEVFVDQPDRPRAELLEDLERVRLRVDQARTTRDSIARGAQADIDRGHLTTAVYEMERAVERFAGQDHTTQREEGTRELVRQLEEAQRRKRALDDAAARNMALATQFSELRRNPSATVAARLAVLIERQDCLRYLIDNVHAERSELYRGDLREVDAQILRLHSARAEATLDSTAGPEAQLRDTQQSLSALEQLVSDLTEVDAATAESVLQTWRKRAQELRTHAARAASEREIALRAKTRRSRIRQLGGFTAIALLSVVAWQARSAFASDPIASLRQVLGRQSSATPSPDQDQELAELRATAATLTELGDGLVQPSGAPVAISAQELLSATDRLRTSSKDPLTFGAEMGPRLRGFRRLANKLQAEFGDHPDGPAIILHLERFANRVSDTVIRWADQRLESEADRARFRALLAGR